MKTLEQIQEENRKLIILANNPEAKSYEEALEMELGFGCLIKCHMLSRGYIMPEYKEFSIINDFNQFNDKYVHDSYYLKNIRVISNDKKSCDKDIILGKPLTLDKVLISLKNSEDGNGFSINVSGCLMHLGSSILRWDLTKPTLEQQSEETQREINKLLTHQ